MRTLLAIALGVLWAECLPAHAWEPTDKDFHVIDKSVKHPATKVKAWRKVNKPKPKGPPVHVVIRLPKPEDDRCRSEVATVGEEAKYEDSARYEAQKNWRAIVRWRYGERFLNLDLAEDLRFACSPSNVPKFGGSYEAAIGAISKRLTNETVRCEIFARPCAAPVQREEDGK